LKTSAKEAHPFKKKPVFLNIQLGSIEVRKYPSPISTKEKEMKFVP